MNSGLRNLWGGSKAAEEEEEAPVEQTPASDVEDGSDGGVADEPDAPATPPPARRPDRAPSAPARTMTRDPRGRPRPVQSVGGAGGLRKKNKKAVTARKGNGASSKLAGVQRVKKDGTPFKKRRWHPGTKAQREINFQQKRCVKPTWTKAGFARLVKECLGTVNDRLDADIPKRVRVERITGTALECLSEASTAFMLSTILEANIIRGSLKMGITLKPEHLKLAQRQQESLTASALAAARLVR